MTVQFYRKPSSDEIERIEKLANTKIAEDLKLEIVNMERKRAEHVYGDDIYDLFPVTSKCKSTHHSHST